MKRYMLLNTSFDYGSNIFKARMLAPNMPTSRNAAWILSENRVLAKLVEQHGTFDLERKLENMLDFGAVPSCVINTYTMYFQQMHRSFIQSGYYPTLISACTLGERILNYIVESCINDFPTSRAYSQLKGAIPSSNWMILAKALKEWGIVKDEQLKKFLQLRDLRNESVHFQHVTEQELREKSLEAVHLIKNLTEYLFGCGDDNPSWFISGESGFIKKSYESHSYIRKILIPHCYYVGYKHVITEENNGFGIEDNHPYPQSHISDTEYIRLWKENRKSLPTVDGTHQLRVAFSL